MDLVRYVLILALIVSAVVIADAIISVGKAINWRLPTCHSCVEK